MAQREQNLRDPLELARRQLDFAAMASAAPSVREVLFKAQTMVPLNPARPWQRTAATAGAVLLIAAAVFAPWIPARQQFAVLAMQFDHRMAQNEAQQAINAVVRLLPEDTLASAEFKTKGPETAGVGEAEGLLTVQLASPRRSRAELEKLGRAVNWAASDAAPGAASFSGEQYSYTDWASPLKRVQALLGAKRAEQTSKYAPGRKLALEILDRQVVFDKALAARYAGGSPPAELTGFAFLSPLERKNAPDYDFMLPTWPAAAALSVHGYKVESESRQADIRAQAEDLLRDASLLDASTQLSSEPVAWMPVIVTALDSAGRPDRVLTSKLQAWIGCPGDGELLSPDFDLEALISHALAQVLPDAKCTVSYERCGRALPNGMRPYYSAVVTVSQRRGSLRDIAEPGEAGDSPEEW